MFKTKMTMITLLMALLTTGLFAQTFSMQGVLRDPLGRTVVDGFYSLTFNIYDVEVSGDALWTAVHGNVDVKHGVFVVELGTIEPLTGLDFRQTYFVGVSVEDEQELEPRVKLTNTPYAIATLGVDNVFPSTGNVGVGTHEPTAALHVITTDDLSDKLLIEGSDGTGFVKVIADGKMGVNVEEPAQALDIEGNLKMRTGSILFDDGSSLSSAYFGGSASSLTNNGNIIITTDADDDSSGNVQFVSGVETVATIDNTGNFDVTGNIQASGTVIAGNIQVSGTVASGSIESSGTVTAMQFFDDVSDYYIDLNSGGNLSGTFVVDGTVNAGILRVDDQYARYMYGGNPVMNFDAYDWMGYNRTDDAYFFVAGAVTSTTIGADGLHSKVFYDFDNDLWYLDPGGSSELYKVTATELWSNFCYPTASYGSWLGSSNNVWWDGYIANVYRNTESLISDSRTKQNIRTVESGLDKVMQLNPVKYDIDVETHPFYKDRELKEGETTTDNLGFIAQELQEVIPEMVEYNDDVELYTIKNYEQMFPVLVKAMQEQQAQIEMLQKRIEELEK